MLCARTALKRSCQNLESSKAPTWRCNHSVEEPVECLSRPIPGASPRRERQVSSDIDSALQIHGVPRDQRDMRLDPSGAACPFNQMFIPGKIVDSLSDRGRQTPSAGDTALPPEIHQRLWYPLQPHYKTRSGKWQQSDERWCGGAGGCIRVGVCPRASASRFLLNRETKTSGSRDNPSSTSRTEQFKDVHPDGNLCGPAAWILTRRDRDKALNTQPSRNTASGNSHCKRHC